MADIAEYAFLGLVGLFVLVVYYILTSEVRYKRYYEDIKDTEWVVGRWSTPSDIFNRYWLFGITIFVPFALWGWVFDYELGYGVLLFILWLACYIPLVHHYLVRPSLKGVSWKARNRNIMPKEVTSVVKMVLDDLGVGYQMYTFSEYKASGPDKRLIWEMKWNCPADYVLDLHPDPPVGRDLSCIVGEQGDVGIAYSKIRLTPYDDGTAKLFDELSDEIDRVLF